MILLSSALSALAGSTETITFTQNGLERRFLLYLPDNLAEFQGPRPLVLVLHGGGGTDRGMVRLTRGRFNDLADEHGFIVAYPNAIGRIWDFGEGKVSETLRPRRDDLAYFRAVLSVIQARTSINPDRVYATGISRGGQASYFLACKLPGTIRAIAPVSMPLPDFFRDDCASGPPVGLLVINGTEDPIVPYHGGTVTTRGKDRGTVLSTDATVALWRKRSGCGGATATAHYDRPGDGTSVDRMEWTDCSRAPVVLYRVNGGGHTWPGGRQYLPRGLVGATSRDIVAADHIWAFFERFK